MKCAAIFCCLLAYCVFETTCVDIGLQAQLIYHRYNPSMKYITDLHDNLKPEIDRLDAQAKAKNKDISECKKNFYGPFEDAVSKTEKSLSDCVQGIETEKEKKDAKDCCTRKMNSGSSRMNFLVKFAKDCIQPKLNN